MLTPSMGAAQTRVGVEVMGGRVDMLIPYVKDRTIFDRNQHVLIGDEVAGGGFSISLRTILITHLELQLSFQSTSRSRMKTRYRSTTSVDPRRERANGTVDDAGTQYEPLIPEGNIDLRHQDRGELMTASLTAAFRYPFFQYKNLFLYANAGAGFALVTVKGNANPWAFGLKARTGVGILTTFASHFGIFLEIRLEGILTGNYTSEEDASRAVLLKGGFTEQATFDGTLFTNITAGFHYAFQ